MALIESAHHEAQVTEILPQYAEIHPLVSTEIFNGHEEQNYWVGKVAVNGIALYPEYYDATAVFRGNIYTDLGFIPSEQLDEFGRDLDGDDVRSVQFSVLERAQDVGAARVIGSGRVIIKSEESEPLPIETHFPDVFADNPIPVNNVEISRFIAKHESASKQHRVALSLIRVMALYGINNSYDTNFCMIEAPLMRHLTSIGLPTEQLGESKNIDELGGELFPVGIKSSEILESVKTDLSGKLLLKKFFENELASGGEGHYDSSFMRKENE